MLIFEIFVSLWLNECDGCVTLQDPNFVTDCTGNISLYTNVAYIKPGGYIYHIDTRLSSEFIAKDMYQWCISSNGHPIEILNRNIPRNCWKSNSSGIKCCLYYFYKGHK